MNVHNNYIIILHADYVYDQGTSKIHHKKKGGIDNLKYLLYR